MKNKSQANKWNQTQPWPTLNKKKGKPLLTGGPEPGPWGVPGGLGGLGKSVANSPQHM